MLYRVDAYNSSQNYDNNPQLRDDLSPQGYSPHFPSSLNGLPLCGPCGIWEPF